MTFQIRSPDGRIYEVRTEVGDGLARVCVEVAEPDEQSIEQQGETE